ncbi:MAG: ABC transporter permease subunit [Chloroflexi bacterium]|nr:ABC transporter permease subunit [Chloroflexota bacterium]
MKAILDIAINDLRIMFKDRSIWINLIVVPIVLSYVIGIANGAGSSGTPTAARLLIDVINLDKGAISQQFLSDLQAANPNFVLCPMDNNEKDVCQLNGAPFDADLSETRLKDQTSLALIDIPAGFSDDINAGKPVSITYRSNESATAPSYILQAVQAETQRLGGALTAAQVGTQAVANFPPLTFKDEADKTAFTDAIRQKASTIWAQNPAQVEYTVAQAAQPTTPNTDSAGFSQSMPGIGTMYAMFIIFPAAAAIILERKTWTLQRMAVMPLSRAQILGGKLLARFATGMFEYALMFSFGFLLGVRYGNDPLAILLLMITFVLAVTALTLALTTLLKNEGQARGIALFLSLTLAPLGGAWWPLDIVPQFMRTIGHLSPVAWVMDGFRSIIFFGGGLGDVILPLLILSAMAVVFFAIGVARFKFTD